MNEKPPFIYCDADLFGLFIVKDGRKEVNRYGALCTCWSIRALNIVFVHSLSTDSFIVSFREFAGCRGNVRMISSENGSNFVGDINKTNDVTSLAPPSPLNLLRIKSKVVMPPPGNFTSPEWYYSIRPTSCVTMFCP